MSQPGQRVGVVAESRAGETRVAATAVTVAQLHDLGYQVVVQRDGALMIVTVALIALVAAAQLAGLAAHRAREASVRS